MNKKQKIILVVSSTSLGLAIILAPFLGKDSSPQKNNDQHLINNSSEEKENNQQLSEKKKKSSVLQIILIIIGIIIIVFVIFLIIKKRKELNNYLSGKCRVLFSKQVNEIQIYYSHRLPIVKMSEKIYQLDILNAKELPDNIQAIYNNLKTEQNQQILTNFGNLITNFFQLIDGYLIQTISNDKTKKHQIIDKMWKKIIDLNKFDLNDTLIYNKTINFTNHKKIAIQENETAMDFFKRVMIGEKPYVENNNKKVFLFEHYFALYDLFLSVADELSTFFKDKEISEQYQKIREVEEKINHFLKNKNLPLN